MADFISVMILPFLACVILAGMYSYLGFHVIERQVIFVDLALAQIAVFGSSMVLIYGGDLESPAAYLWSLGFVMLGAAIFAMTRFKKQRVPQEAVIGITYAVSAALLVMVLSRSGEGDEHIKQALIGNILLVTQQDIVTMLLVCVGVGVVHLMFHRIFFIISQAPDVAVAQGFNVRWWDFVFYLTFGLVVTSSVRTAGVLLVFAFLVVPSVCALLFSNGIKVRLMIGWAVGLVASLVGMGVSYYYDFPTGASVVCVFGLILLILSGINSLLRLSGRA